MKQDEKPDEIGMKPCNCGFSMFLWCPPFTFSFSILILFCLLCSSLFFHLDFFDVNLFFYLDFNLLSSLVASVFAFVFRLCTQWQLEFLSRYCQESGSPFPRTMQDPVPMPQKRQSEIRCEFRCVITQQCPSPLLPGMIPICPALALVLRLIHHVHAPNLQISLESDSESGAVFLC